jgi:hypothetical protein
MPDPLYLPEILHQGLSDVYFHCSVNILSAGDLSFYFNKRSDRTKQGFNVII